MAHRYRLYPVLVQETICRRHCEHSRFVFNLALEQASCYRPEWGSTPGPAERQRQLAEARRTFPWLAEGSSSVQQQALRVFDRAMANFFSRTHRFPTWRKAGVNESFCIRDVRINRLGGTWATITIPKIGAVRFRLSRPLPKDYGMARVTLDRAGRWHVSLSSPQAPVDSTGDEVVGIDLGIANSATTSAGDHISMPALLSNGEAQSKRRLQRRLARQSIGSKNRDKTRAAIARLCARQADRRKDFIEKTTTRLVAANSLIAIEDLEVKNMMASAAGTAMNPGTNVAAKSGLNREIANQSWSTLRRRLTDKAMASDVRVIAVNPRFTSQRCSACGHIDRESRESQAAFSCRACRHTEHADVNAARNILAAGLAVTARGGTPDYGPVEARTTPVAA